MKWKVQALEKACLKITVEKPGEGSNQFPPAELTRLSVYVDFVKASKITMTFELENSPEANKFRGMLPWACLKQPSKLGKDVVARL